MPTTATAAATSTTKTCRASNNIVGVVLDCCVSAYFDQRLLAATAATRIFPAQEATHVKSDVEKNEKRNIKF